MVIKACYHKTINQTLCAPDKVHTTPMKSNQTWLIKPPDLNTSKKKTSIFKSQDGKNSAGKIMYFFDKYIDFFTSTHLLMATYGLFESGSKKPFS